LPHANNFNLEERERLFVSKNGALYITAAHKRDSGNYICKVGDWA
jgi:hypothetical protein